MVTTLLFDFSWVLLFPKDSSYLGELNKLHQKLFTNKSYSFLDNFYLNQPLLDYLNKIKNSKELYIFTSGTIQHVPEIKEQLVTIFKQIFSATELSLSKKDPRAYQKILERIGKQPTEVLFIDDSATNIAAAQLAGLQTTLYTDFETLKAKLDLLS